MKIPTKRSISSGLVGIRGLGELKIPLKQQIIQNSNPGGIRADVVGLPSQIQTSRIEQALFAASTAA
jgi:hypothetical protein